MNLSAIYLLSDKIKFLGVKLLDTEELLELLFRFGLNMLVVFIVVKVLYYNITKRKDYLFTYVLFGLIIFFLCNLLDNVKIELGFALGLFAIFGIIRYRTSQIPIKEMTYLFIVIGISVINALANKKVTYAELIFTNSMIILVTYLLEKVWLLKHEASKIIEYEKINLILPEKREELLLDLKTRTGLNIHNLEIGKLDFLKDSAQIKIYYYEDQINSINTDDSNFN